jgi:Ca2+-binding RTX toxin-like protein
VKRAILLTIAVLSLAVFSGTAAAHEITWIGTSGSDSIEGHEHEDNMYGKDGPDFLYGYAGGDWLEGQRGNDTILAGGNSDFGFGGRGDDAMSLGWGADQAWGGWGNDFIAGDDGNDIIRLNDDEGERDEVFCGSGWDIVYTNRQYSYPWGYTDRIHDDCEVIRSS